jgi:hypothetical protein
MLEAKHALYVNMIDFIFFFTVRSVRREVKSYFVGSRTREDLRRIEREAAYAVHTRRMSSVKPSNL